MATKKGSGAKKRGGKFGGTGTIGTKLGSKGKGKSKSRPKSKGGKPMPEPKFEGGGSTGTKFGETERRKKR